MIFIGIFISLSFFNNLKIIENEKKMYFEKEGLFFFSYEGKKED